MENKNTVLALALCVITLASLNLIQLISNGRVLGETTSASPLPREVKETRIVEIPRIDPNTDRQVSCTALEKFVFEQCSSRPTPIVVPTIVIGKTVPPTTCNPGVTKISYTGDCKSRTDSTMALYTTANFVCHDGYVGTVGGKANGCVSSGQLSELARQACISRGCTGTPPRRPKELDRSSAQ